MYISDITHFLNEQGNIPTEMPKEARELASFHVMVVDSTTKTMPSILTSTDLRCFKKACHGLIKTAVKHNDEEIHWYCPECENEGIISHWQGSRWDNRFKK